jgi:hypothetical protein
MCTADQGPEPGALTDSADFPARIVYAINYNIFVNKVRFIEDQAGIAQAVGVHAIPPRDVRVAFDKPHAGDVLGQYLEFREGTCTGMKEISADEFYRGIEYCRYWRSVRLDTSAGTIPGPPPPTP